MKALLLAPSLFLGLIMLALPSFSQPGLYFGVRVPEGFRQSAVARRLAFYYRLQVIAWTAAALLSAWLGSAQTALPVFMVLIPLSGGMAAWALAHRRVLPFSAPAGPREASLAPDEGLPAWTWLSAVPYSALGACAAYLHAHFVEIPDRFPVHFGMDGEPNRWLEKSPAHVYQPLIVSLLLMALMLALAVGIFHAVRRSRMRRMMLGVMVGTQYMLAYSFCLVSLLPLLRPPMWAMLAPMLLFVLVTLVAFAVANRRPGAEAADNAPDSTPDERWIGGWLYYNPDDPSLMVEKRSGLGYTLNFGHKFSWVVVALLVIVIGAVSMLAK
jgi:uncharacterized membrane protein